MVVRWIIGIIAALLLFVAGWAYHLASSVVQDRHDFESQVRQWVSERTTILEIEEIDEYRGKQSYAVVTGKNQAGTPVIAWLTEEHAIMDRFDLAVPKKSVEEAVKKSYPQSQITRIVPGMDGEQRFWEVTMEDQDGRFHYLHFNLYTGELLMSYVLSPT